MNTFSFLGRTFMDIRCTPNTLKNPLNVLHMKGFLSNKVHIGDLPTKLNCQSSINTYHHIHIYNGEVPGEQTFCNNPTTQIVDQMNLRSYNDI